MKFWTYIPQSTIIAVPIPDKRQNMFHELRNWRNHCLHSLLKVPISKIFFKSYIFFLFVELGDFEFRDFRFSKLFWYKFKLSWTQKPDFRWTLT